MMTLSAIMKLNTAGFTNPLQSVRAGIGSTIGKLAALTGGALSVAGSLAGLRNAIKIGGDLNDLSAQTGVAVKDLVVLRQAFEDAGAGAGAVPAAINIMQRSLAGVSESGEPTNKMFDRLGLNIEALKKLNPAAQFETIGKAIGGIKDPAEQTAATMAIFGRSGAALKAIFADPAAIENTRKALGSLPDVMQKNAALFDKFDTQMGQLKTKLSGIFAGVMENLSPVLTPILDRLASVDFAAWGRKIGMALGVLVEAFKEGRLGELLGLSLRLGAAQGVNYLVGGLRTAVEFLSDLLGNGSFWKGIANVALGAFEGIGGALIRIFTKPITFLQAGMDVAIGMLVEGISKIPGLRDLMGIGEGYTAPTFEEARKNRETDTPWLVKQGEAALAESTKRMGAGSAQVGDALAQAIVNTGKFKPVEIFGTDELRAKLGAIWDQLSENVKKAVVAGQEKANAGVAAAGTGKMDQPEKAVEGKAREVLSDRLARIGGFVGGGGAGLDHARRTATATERMARAIDKSNRLLEVLSGNTGVTVLGA